MGSKPSKPFHFKQFTIHQDRCMMKVGTDGVLLGAWADLTDTQLALDIGTGSGIIAIMMAQRSADLEVHAVEVDAEACTQAIENMQNTPWANRLRAFQTTIQEYAEVCEHKYDLIVSNPPFFSGGVFSHNQDKNSVRHTLKMPHGDLLGAARSLLKPDGRFCVILPLIEGLRFCEMAQHYHLVCTRQTEVRPKADKPIERLLLQFEREAKPMLSDSIVIQKGENNDWTEGYIALMKAFYLKM